MMGRMAAARHARELRATSQSGSGEGDERHRGGYTNAGGYARSSAGSTSSVNRSSPTMKGKSVKLIMM